MINSGSLRILSFGVGLVAVIALTATNVYSLFELRTSTIEAAKEEKKGQIEDFTRNIRFRMSAPIVSQIHPLDVKHTERSFQRNSEFPRSMRTALSKIAENPVFTGIYFSPHNMNHCSDPEQPIYRFNPDLDRTERVADVPDQVCGGLGLARSSIKVLIDSYRYSIKVTYETHRSMTLTLINDEDASIFGHINLQIDRDHLVNELLTPVLRENFGPGNQTGIAVWVVDRATRRDVIAASDETIPYEHKEMHFAQRFPEMFDSWLLKAQYIESPAIAASNASFVRNLIILGAAVFTLFGALIFMYVTSKRERELAQRQAGFLANITHEFKTPLAAMQAAGENISDGRVPNGPRLKTYGNHIYNETIRLRKMIDQLLDIARVDSGESMVQKTPLKLSLPVQRYFDENQAYITSRGFNFRLKIEKSLPLINVDPDHVETIVRNLVENALKYSSDRKEITIELQCRGSRVQLLVKDRGIGIPKKAHKSIFNKFYRLEDSMTARTKGHGLGLTIVKNLAELNSGETRVISKPGEGSTFIVSFPVYSESSPEVEQGDSSGNGWQQSKQGELSEHAES